MDEKKNYEISGKTTKEIKKIDLDKNAEIVKAETEYPYNVRINDIWGTTSKEITSFGVKRFIEGVNVYLVNEKMGFKEYMPVDDDDFKLYSQENISKRIKQLEKQLGSDKKTENPRSLKSELRFLRNRHRSLEVQGRGSYIRFDQSGKPFFEFDRIGNFKVPVFKNVDYSTLDVPSETRIKTAAELLLENDNKNGEKNLGAKIFMGVMMFLMLAGVFGGLFFAWKTAQLPDVCAANLERASQVLEGVTNKISQTSNNLQNLSSNLQIKKPEIDTTPPVNVVE